MTLYGWFVIANRKDIGKIPCTISIGFLITALIGLNLPYLAKKPISITKLTPYIYQQDYGNFNVHMPTNAKKSDPTTWDRLSTQYVFYDQGLGTHANSTIAYDIGKRFSIFETDMGIDTEAGPKGSVVFSIEGDGVLLYQSPVVTRYQYPIHASVSVLGISELKLVVTDAGNGNTDDHADWLRPILIP